jgi:uncharacterized damage-inducible protein DinB
MSPSARQQFRTFYEREHATTARVLGSFPPEQAAFTPSDRSNSAQSLAWTFVSEERMLLLALQGKPILGSGVAMNPPDSWAGILAEFDKVHADVLRELDVPGGEELEGTVRFFTGPKQMGEIPTRDFAFFMIHDQIHHRGQLSVYLRMVGGKVPSIYGPSADEPWT